MPSAKLTKGLTDDDYLIDDPDILMDLPGVISVARLRFRHGTRYELALTRYADTYEREAAFGLLPPDRTFLRCEDTVTLGGGGETTFVFWSKD